MDRPVEDATLRAIPSAPPTITPVTPTEAAPKATTEKTYRLAEAINYSIANYGASLFYGLFNFAMPFYLDSYKLPAWLIGLLANERSFVGAFVQPVVGRISDRTHTRFGKRRPFFLIGIPLTCVALFVLALHPPLWAMIGVMAVTAFFLAIAWDPYMALLGDLWPASQRGRVGGLIGLGGGIGNFALAIIAVVMWANAEFQVFMIVIVALIVTWAYTFFTVKEPPVDPDAVVEDRPKFNLRKYIADLRRFPELQKYIIAITFFWLGTGGAIVYLTLFAKKVLGASEGELFYLPIGAIVATALFAIPAGYIADRVGKKRTMFVGMLIYGIVALIGSQSATLLQGIVALFLIGIANAAMSQINPMMTDLVPHKRMAEFIGVGSAVFSMAQPVGSVVAGGVVGLSGLFVSEHDTYRFTFIVAGLLIITSAFLLQRVHPERPIPED